MALLGYWPPAAHLTLLAICAATAWWRFETAPAVPSGVAGPADLVAPARAAAGAEDTGARDWRGDVASLASRPLFRPGRLVAADAAPQTEARAAEAPTASGPAASATFRMTGYFDLNGRRSAILETVEDGESHIVNEGDEIAGAQVRQISPGAVVIETAGRQVTVKLYPD